MLFVIGADRSCKQPRGARKRPAAGETCRFRAANGAVQATRQGSLFAARRKCRAPVIRNSSQSGGSLFLLLRLTGGARTPVDFFKNPRRGKFSVLLANGGVAAEENLAFQNACVLKMASPRNPTKRKYKNSTLAPLPPQDLAAPSACAYPYQHLSAQDDAGGRNGGSPPPYGITLLLPKFLLSFSKKGLTNRAHSVIIVRRSKYGAMAKW